MIITSACTPSSGKIRSSQVVAELALTIDVAGGRAVLQTYGEGYGMGFSLAIAGDWGDKWGLRDSLTKQTTTRDSMIEAGKDDLLVLVGDLSYGKDTGVKHGPEQARHWCNKAQKFSNNKPMIFVPGDHDSKLQDGDIPTYVECLTATAGLLPMVRPRITWRLVRVRNIMSQGLYA